MKSHSQAVLLVAGSEPKEDVEGSRSTDLKQEGWSEERADWVQLGAEPFFHWGWWRSGLDIGCIRATGNPIETGSSVLP